MNEHSSRTPESELADARNQLARTDATLRDSRRVAADLAKENAILRALAATTVSAAAYNELEGAYRQLESRFIAQNEAVLARTNEEIDEMNTFLHAVRSSRFWILKDAIARLRRREAH